MKVLIVGGNGYIGSRMVQLWHDTHELTVRDTGDFGGRSYRLSSADYEGQQAVIWLASISNNEMNRRTPWLCTVVNRDLVECATMLASKAGVSHFIYASSVAAYGNVENATEDMPLEPTTDYGSDKKWCERMLSGQGNGIPWTVVRAASVFGHSPNMRFDTPINRMTRAALSRMPLTVYGGDQKRCHVHIDDLINLYQIILSEPHLTSRRAFNAVAFSESIMDTADAVAGICNVPIMRESAKDTRSYTASCEYAKRTLQWYCQKDTASGVRDMIAKRDEQYADFSNARERLL